MISFPSVAVEYHSTIKTEEMLSAAPFPVEHNCTTIGRDLTFGLAYMGSHIRERIKAARQHAKLSQEKLGEYIGVSKSAVSMWETDNPKKHTRPTLGNLKLISQWTGAPIEWLLDDSADIAKEWKHHAEVIEFPTAAIVAESPRLGDIAIEAAKIIDSLPKDAQIEIIHYLRIRSQTKA